MRPAISDKVCSRDGEQLYTHHRKQSAAIFLLERLGHLLLVTRRLIRSKIDIISGIDLGNVILIICTFWRHTDVSCYIFLLCASVKSAPKCGAHSIRAENEVLFQHSRTLRRALKMLIPCFVRMTGSIHFEPVDLPALLPYYYSLFDKSLSH